MIRMRPACSYNVQPDSEAREAEAELGFGRHIWQALMADIGGTRYVTTPDERQYAVSPTSTPRTGIGASWLWKVPFTGRE